MNPLHKAAESGDINKVRELLETGTWDVNKRVEILGFEEYQQNAFEGGSAPLHFATSGCPSYVELVAQFIQHGADPCSTDKGGSAPLHFATRGGHSDVELVALLIQHGADPCSTDEYGRTSLHFAAFYGHSDIVALLIQHGADPCCTDRDGFTPLHNASRRGNSDIAALLIQQGADPCSTDSVGRTPLHKAAENGHSEVAAVLIQQGANLCITDKYEGGTPLHIAAFCGQCEVAALLIQHGADPYYTDRWGRTPLHYAAEGGHSNVVVLLIEHGADPCSTTENGRTPLYYAVQGGHSDVAALLIQHGADPCSRDRYGSTPLHYAAEGYHSDIVALLIQHGADPCCIDQHGRRPRGTQGLATHLMKFENGLVQNFILIMSLEHVASTMNIAEANTLFKYGMSRHFPKERHNKKLEMLRNWADAYGIKSLQDLKRRLAEAGCPNLAAAAAKHYAEIVKEIMDMSAECYGTFCKDPMSQRHMITSAGCSTERRCEISIQTDSYQYDACVAHHSDDEEVADELRGQLEPNGVRCSESPLPGSFKIKSMCEAVEMARRTVSIFSKTSLESESFNLTCNVALGEAEKRKESVMILVTTDVDPKSLPTPYNTMQSIPFQSHDFIPKLVDAIKGPTDVPLYGELRDENENLKREIAALRQQLEDLKH